MKKIISIILSMALSVGLLTGHAAADNDRYRDTLAMLGVLEDAKEEETVTRGEFTKMALRLLGIEVMDYTGSGEMYFVDVDADYEYYNDVITAYKKGIINGYSKEYFAPEEAISAEQCVKVLLSAMNYTDMANVRGGYPTGYMTIAEETGMLDGVSNTAGFVRDDILRILYNALSVPMADVKINGDGVSYGYDGDNTLLSAQNIRTEEGIVTAAGQFSAYITSTNYRKNQLAINHVSYDCDLEYDADEILGMCVKAYIDKDSEKIVAVELSKKNSITQVKFDDYEKIDEKSFFYYDGTREKKVKISDRACVLLNSSYLGNVEYCQKNGVFDDFDNAVLIDNDSDANADIIKLVRYQYELVETVYPNDNTIAFANGKGSLKFEDDDIAEFYKDGMGFSLAMLLENDTVMIKKSDLVSGGKYYSVTVARNEIKGTLEGIREENGKRYFSIGGTEYELAKEYQRDCENEDFEYRLTTGNYITAYIAGDNKIVFAKTEGEFTYGYLMKIVGDSTEEDYFAKIFTLDKEEKRLDFAEKVRVYSDDSEFLYGKKMEREAAYRYVAQTKNYRYGMVMFAENEAGELTTLILPKNIADKEPGNDPYPLCENLSDVSGGEWSIGYSYFGVLAFKYLVNNNAVNIFYAPQKEENKADKTQYDVKSGRSMGLSFAFTKGATVKLYNVDKLYKPEVILTESNDGVEATVENTDFAAVVKKLSYEADSDGMEKLKLTYMQKGTEKEAFFAEDAKAVNPQGWHGCGGKTAADAKPGDVLLLGIDNSDNIRSYRYLFKQDDRGNARNEGGDTNAFGHLTISYGTCAEKGSTAVLVNVQGKIFPAHLTTAYEGTKYYYLIEKKGAKKVNVSAITMNDVRKGDEIVARKRYNEAVEFFVYR